MLNRTSTSFPIAVTAKIKELYKEYENSNSWNSVLKYYQYIVMQLFVNKNMTIKNSRGLLVYFPMGLGKTRTAASVALTIGQEINIIVLLPKSLQQNFENTVSFLIKELGITRKKRIKFISLNAFNVGSQLESIGENIHNSLIIIDEAHNLFRSIIAGNSSSNAQKIYNLLMQTKGIKILLLTGTPISKDPFELVPCINLLAGEEVLPPYYDQFNSLYVDEVNNKVVNRSYLANRILGLVSYSKISDSDMFPTENPTVISELEMSDRQYRRYIQARDKEELNKKLAISQETKVRKRIAKMSLPSKISMHAYYVESRSYSNYIEPLEPGMPLTEENSPKFTLIAKRVKEQKGLSIVYSQFVNTHGLRQLALFLDDAGFENYDQSTDELKPKYAFFVGDILPKKREAIINTFNSLDNIYGKHIKVLLISKTGAEGLDLLNVRATHQIEPYWDLSRDKQLKSRAIRYGSHINLPLEERNVTPYLYISKANKDVWKDLNIREEKTIDQVFHDRSVERDKLNMQFNDLLQDVSIECTYFGLKESCYTCKPNNNTLFTDDPTEDIQKPNPCIKYSTTEVDAQRVTIDSMDYYYILNPLRLYKYNISLDGYTEVEMDQDMLEKIRKEIGL